MVWMIGIVFYVFIFFNNKVNVLECVGVVNFVVE